jgi:hypothetical protein
MSILTKEEITYFKENKQEITFELLQALRNLGNEGKQLALNIIDLPKDSDQYYLDAFGNRVSQNGNRNLKKPFTKLNLSPIHIEEIDRCMNDIFYFMDNYVKIKTKQGVNFPELRTYQKDFISSILPDENEDNIGLMGRQSGKSVSTAIYLAHAYNFSKEMNIGIVANKGPMAREFLANAKNIIISLPIWMQLGTITWNKGSIENENLMRILTDVPSQDSFRGFTISILVCDEAAFIRPTVWQEFSDSIFPSQSGLSFKKKVILSTANGQNHFYHLVAGARKDSNGYKIFEVDWRDVPRFDSKGNIKDPEVFKNEIIRKHGEIYFNQNYGNDFVGSSYTLLSSDTLKNLESQEPINLITPGLKIYKKPQKGHKYIMSVDPSKDGADAFAVNILDITDMNFEQVAAGQIQIDYLLMPEYLVEWGEWYNFAYIIIENNEGAGQSIADTLYKVYEYENMFFDVKTDSSATNATKIRKKYPGFRTTSKTRKLILATMKLFIENGNLILHDKTTIDEQFTFILINGKYQADEGCHDDAVMSLAIAFAPFCSTKNFNDMKILVSSLYKRDDGNKKVDLSEIFLVGGFDDGVHENGNFTGDIVDEFGGVVNYYDTLDISNFG